MILRLFKKQTDKKLRRNLSILAWNEFFAELRLYYPVAVLVFESVTGSFTTAMAVFAALKISQAVFEIPTGVFSDKIGRKKTFIVGSMAELIGSLCLALAFIVPYGALLLYLGATCFGFANSLFSGNNDAMIHETLLYYRRSKEMPVFIGRLRSMGQLALAISGVLAALCLWFGLSYQMLVVLTLLPTTLSLLFSFFLVEPPRHIVGKHNSIQHMKEAVGLIWKNPSLLKIACASSIKNGLGDSSYALGPGFVESLWPLWLTPLFRTAQNVFGMVGFWLSGRIIKSVGLFKSIYLGTLYSYVMYLVGYIEAAVYSPLLFLTTQISYAVSSTADTTLQQERFSDQQRATMGSIISIATTVVGSIGSVLLGYMADVFGLQIALIILLVLGMPSAVIYFSLFKKDQRKP